MSVTLASKVFWTDIPVLTYVDKKGNTVTVGKSTLKFILLAIADNADDFGENSYQSFETIATKTSMERRTVIRGVRALIRNGYLKIAGASRYGTNNYVIPTDKLGEQPKSRSKVGRPKTSDSEVEIGDSGANIGDSGAEIGDSTPPESSFNPPEPPLTEVVRKANQTVDAVLEAERKAQSKEAWKKWKYRDEIPDAMHPLLDAFVRVSKLVPSKKELSLWLMVGNDWLEAGLTPEHIEKAYDYANRDGGFLVTGPNSLTKTAIGIKAKGGLSQSVLPTVEETKAKLDEQERKVVPRPDYVPRPLLKKLESKWSAK